MSDFRQFFLQIQRRFISYLIDAIMTYIMQ